MNASIKTTAWLRQAAIIASQSAAVSDNGFSHRICLPASAHRIVHSRCIELGSGM